MFSNSPIAKDFYLTHLINFAIATHFIKTLIDELKSCDYYSIPFDESLNEITQTYQMGVHVHYLTISVNQRCVHYLDSKFMCHATVNDLLTNFIGMINNVDDGSHIIQDRYIK